jgi:hypothetical protein
MWRKEKLENNELKSKGSFYHLIFSQEKSINLIYLAQSFGKLLINNLNENLNVTRGYIENHFKVCKRNTFIFLLIFIFFKNNAELTAPIKWAFLNGMSFF